MTTWKLLALISIFGAALMVAGLVPTAHAQEQGEVESPVPEIEEPPQDDVILDLPEPDREPAIVTRDADDTISVDFPDEQVRVIIRSVADLFDLNVVIPEGLIGNVSIKLRNVTWQQVFDVVLDPIGYTWVEDRNIIRIKSHEEMEHEPVDTRVFVISFARADELRPSIEPLVDQGVGGRIQVDTRSNSLVITERPTRINMIQEIIERLDRPTDQVMIESKFIEITSRAGKDVGIDWGSLGALRAGVSDIQRDWTRERDQQASHDGPTESFQRDTTTSFDNLTGRQTQGTTTVTRSISETMGMMSSLAQGRADQAIFSASAFNLVLSALQTEGDVEVVSNPTVVTMNNTAAQINIGEEFPIPQFTYNPQQGTFEISGFEFKPIGVILNVTPQVNAAGFITLNIVPEISLRTDSVSFGPSGASIPIIQTRKTESTVTIKSGFTLAIGGLIEDSISSSQSKVPILGDVPLLGRLFRKDSSETEKRNLVIFITARVLNPDGSTYEEVFSQKRLSDMGITERDIPGFEPSAEEEDLYRRLRNTREQLDRMQAESKVRQQLEQIEEGTIRATEHDERDEGYERRRTRHRPTQP